MNIVYRILSACMVLSVAQLHHALAAEPAPQQAATYFAGLVAPVTDSERKSFQSNATTAWENYEKRVGQPLLGWAKQEVAYNGGDTVFYPFSGPDFLTVARIYPNAERYILVAQQQARRPVYPQQMNEIQRLAFAGKLGSAWRKFGMLGYFRTEDLDDDQHDKNVSLGVTTILMAFAARLGYEVLDVHPLGFNPDKGEWEVLPASGAQWKSVRLLLQKDERKVTLDYLSMDLSDEGMRKHPPLKDWLARVSGKPALLKAASHLLQEPYFGVLRGMLVSSAPIVVQDETGLDYKDLAKIGIVRLYGNFIQPHKLFKSTPQSSLADAYRAEKVKGKLPFAFSYLKESGTRSIQIVRRSPLIMAQPPP